MNIKEFANKRVLIIGYGREGKSTERFLQKNVPGVTITVVDQKDGPDYLKNQNAFDIRIKSAGIQKHLITKPYSTAANIFFGSVKGLKIGVTGTKGKSTTSSLIFDILKNAGKKVHLVGNIGKPWFDDLGPQNSEDEIYVCELSSYQLDDIEYSPNISVFVSFFPEHMNYHGSVENYWQAKSRILKFASKSDYFVYNPKFEVLKQLASLTVATAIAYRDFPNIAQSTMSLIGEHNQDNIRAARTVAGLLCIDEDVIMKSILHFIPLPHRLQKVGEFHGIVFYDDAISTTPESTMSAVDSLPDISVILLGGLDRGYNFEKLVAKLHEKHIKNIVLFPDSGEKIEQIMRASYSGNFHILKTSDMKKAVQFAYQYATEGSICLLSTASPSYSVWKNFEEKGDLYQKYIRELGQ